MLKKIDNLVSELQSHEDLRKSFQKNPAKFLKERGINPDDLPEKIMDQIAGAGLNLPIFGGPSKFKEEIIANMKNQDTEPLPPMNDPSRPVPLPPMNDSSGPVGG